jgi:hypothetical protein
MTHVSKSWIPHDQRFFNRPCFTASHRIPGERLQGVESTTVLRSALRQVASDPAVDYLPVPYTEVDIDAGVGVSTDGQRTW